MAICCRDLRYKSSQFKAVFDLMESQQPSTGAAIVDVAAADVDTRGLGRYQAAFEERCA